jgi:hypothetical protein
MGAQAEMAIPKSSRAKSSTGMPRNMTMPRPSSSSRRTSAKTSPKVPKGKSALTISVKATPFLRTALTPSRS